MSRKRYSPEHIINILREAEVLISKAGETFGSERLTGALLDRLTHHVNILEINGDSYRLSQSRARRNSADS